MDTPEIKLSRWTGEFLDAGQEFDFQTDAWPRLCRSLRLIALIAGSVFIAALYLNWNGFGEGLAFRTMLALRLSTGLAFLGIAFVSRPSWPQQRAHALFLLTILFMVATRLVENLLAVPLGRPAAHAAIPVIPVMPLVAFAVLAIPARLAIIWSGVGSLLFLWTQVAAWGMHAPSTQIMLLYLLLANGVGYAFRVAWNRITRRDFALRLELVRAEQEAHRANAAKGRFLAVMSHEIRTPLNAVLGGVQLLEETALLPEQRQPLELVARNGNQLALLLDDVLDLARIEAGRLELAPEPFCPADLLAGVHAALYAQARTKGLALRMAHGAWRMAPCPRASWGMACGCGRCSSTLWATP